jgi:glycerophosphoryl diester phosphodiesterase
MGGETQIQGPAQGRWPYPRWVAHRGGGTLAPENTLAGLHLAARLGYRAVEFDVKLSRDGVPILMHDDTLERTTDGHGPVAARSLADLRGLDAGRWFSERFARERVPTLEEAAQACQSQGLWANVEVKPCPGRDAETGRVVALEAARLWAGHPLPPLLSSFSPEALATCQVAAPGLARALLVAQPPADWCRMLDELAAVALHCDHAHTTHELAQAVHATGRGVLCYTVNDPDTADRLLAWGVDALVTDRPDLLPAR